MGLFSKPIPGLYNGVSQQPPSMRLDTQVESQENFIGTIVDGLVKRPGTIHLAELSDSKADSNCLVHRIFRDKNERYIVIASDDQDEPIEVYTLDGTKCTVLYDGDSKSYLTDGDLPAKERVKMLTIADYTFVLNREKTTALTSDVSGGSIKDTVQTFPDLPDDSSTGDIYKIEGDDMNDFASYYVKAISSGVHEETVAPGIPYRIDAATMPHALVRTGHNEFTFQSLEWKDRIVGDEDTAPIPSFIDSKINNLFFYKNRLGFLANDNVIFSAAGDYYNFFPKTVLDILDDDPIDIGTSSSTVTDLQSTAVFEKNLLVFSTLEQFSIGAGDTILTPETVSATPTTSFETVENTEPVRCGPNVYFLCPNGKHMTMREYLVQPDSLINDAANVSAHCPNYIPKGDFALVSTCTALDWILLTTAADPKTLYNYKFYWNGNEKAQSAWFKFSFQDDAEILGHTVYQTDLYLVFKRGGKVYLEKMDLKLTPDSPLGFSVHLDRKTEVSPEYDEENNISTFNLPYEEAGELTFVDSQTGLELFVTKVNDTTYEASGDYSENSYHVGMEYEAKVRLSKVFMKDARDLPVVHGRSQLRYLTLSFVDTAYFRIVTGSELDKNSDRENVGEYTGIMVGSSDIGKITLNSDEIRFPVFGEAKYTYVDIINDSYLPSKIQSGVYELMFNAHSRT